MNSINSLHYPLLVRIFSFCEEKKDQIAISNTCRLWCYLPKQLSHEGYINDWFVVSEKLFQRGFFLEAVLRLNETRKVFKNRTGYSLKAVLAVSSVFKNYKSINQFVEFDGYVFRGMARAFYTKAYASFSQNKFEVMIENVITLFNRFSSNDKERIYSLLKNKFKKNPTIINSTLWKKFLEIYQHHAKLNNRIPVIIADLPEERSDSDEEDPLIFETNSSPASLPL